ncbi:MAG: exosortase C-terminal domain/associated protein EpsI [candidate division Zixibacteria bacterium]
MNRTHWLAISILLIGGIFGNYLRYTEHMPDQSPNFQEIPYQLGQYSGVEQRFEKFAYEVLQADTTTLRKYSDLTGRKYWLFVAYFESQKYGSQIHSPKHCLPGGGWQIDSHESFEVELSEGTTSAINRLVIADRDRRQLMFYWYESRSGMISGEFSLKFDLVLNSMMLRPTDAAMVRLNMTIGENDTVESATELALKFLRDYYPSLSQALPFDS